MGVHRVAPLFFGGTILRLRIAVALFGFLYGMTGAHAQVPGSITGTIINLSAFGEATHPNDEARMILWVEEQHAEKAVAASRVNQKMRQGMEIVAREDTRATLKTRGYYSHPIYPEQPRPSGSTIRNATGWRVGQYLELTTTNLAGLPKLVAAMQSVLVLNGLHFGLSKVTIKKLDEQRMDAAYNELQRRIAIVTKAMGRNMNDVVVEKIEFNDPDIQSNRLEAQTSVSMRAAAPMDAMQVSEPSFEPGETTLGMQVSGKLRIK